MSFSKTIINDVTELIGQTPLIRLHRIPPKGIEILGKLESYNPGGSVKDRPCLAMIEEAERKGVLKKGATIIEPTSGNTGIGLAMICAVKGYRCVLTMPEAMSLERIYLLRLYGAEVVLTPARDGILGAIKKSEELAKKISNSFIPHQFENKANVESHRGTTALEILEACHGKLDAFVAGVGTGGTITGTGEVLKERIPHVKIVAVEPQASAVLSGQPAGRHNIQGIGAGFIPKILNRKIIDEIIPVSDKDAFAMSRRLGKEEGLSVGISSGAAVVAALKIAEQLKEGARIVVILCDTGERYFSMEQYFEA
ncbi:MAG: cysteine synthase A [Omnitrophica WOR_2 bacterium RIFCSPHIGHO2_01_FULL_48_9]|nr:MAG: cysteine synthase A [Omnitrophica WOR_2 bacterium RIFCSPHIGHO2_02_FULL_48_11]OGX34028.1 MAG: cysteine synthase A [Omnitrophica WOR_2 bacterium RIFCSPHIGHO2_01_FULL_48_9]